MQSTAHLTVIGSSASGSEVATAKADVRLVHHQPRLICCGTILPLVCPEAPALLAGSHPALATH